MTMHTKAWVALSAMAMLVAQPAFAATYYLDVDWAGTASGTASQPFTSIGQVITATGGSGTHTVKMGGGVYKSTLAGGQEIFGSTGYDLTGGNFKFEGGYAGYQGGSSFDWDAANRVLPVAGSLNDTTMTVVDLGGANSRALYSGGYRGNGSVDGMAFRNSNVTQSNYNGGAVNLGGTGFGNVRISNSVFENNTTTGQGGGAYVNTRSYSTPSVRDSAFVGNSAGSGGGLAVRPGNGYTTVSNLYVADNTSSGRGGGIFVSASQVDVLDSLIEGNTAGSQGGGIGLNDRVRVNVYRATLAGNTADDGGAVGGSGWYGPKIRLENAVVVGNTTNNGTGAVYTSQGYSEAWLGTYLSTIAGNTGGGLNANGSTMDVISSIIADNGAFGIWAGSNTTANLSFLDVVGQTEDYKGSAVGVATDSISLDPMFVDAANGDYYLMLGSPALDSADPGTLVLVDRDGNVRPIGAGFDMGAYEGGVVPEPGTLALLGLGAVGGLLRRRRR